MIRRQHVVRDFFEGAEAMRGALDERFKDAYTESIRWHYFCDPQMYAYLRTTAKDLFSKDLFERFMQHLRSWCIENLGLMPVHLPSLHLMVNGCKLGLHSDFHNGVWGYVYSLTRWDNRKFSGGETLLLRDGIPSYKKHHVQGKELFELFPAHFNQLLVFDDRMVHATPVIEGSMDPMEGRIALVGHIRATAPIVSGNIQWSEARRVVLDALPHLRERLRSYKDVQGTLTYRLLVGPMGAVDSVTVLTDNIITPITGYDRSDSVEAARALVRQTLAALRFSASYGKSTVTVAVLIPLPDLRPLEFSVVHQSQPDALFEHAATRLQELDELEFQGRWEGQTYIVREPVAGTIRIEANEIVCSFDPPMWVPSQRERFQVALMEWVKGVSAGESTRSLGNQ